MSVSIKSEHEIELMRHAGHLLEKVHDELASHIRPGISTKELDRIGEDMIRSMGCTPNFLNYEGFPASFCISLNDEVVHGREEYDRQKIKEETGIDAPCFIYRPSTWVYEECVIDAETRNARMFYTNENQYQFFIYMNKESNNIQEVLDVEGKILSEYDIFDRYLRINIRVQNLQGNKEKDYYKAEFNYNDTYYLVIGKMEKEEFDQIIEKIMF